MSNVRELFPFARANLYRAFYFTHIVEFVHECLRLLDELIIFARRMASGSVIVEQTTPKTPSEGPLIADKSKSPVEVEASDMQPNSAPSFRRHSIAFRSSTQKSPSSSEDDDTNDFSAEFRDMHKRRYSMDLRRTRLNQSRMNVSYGLLSKPTTPRPIDCPITPNRLISSTNGTEFATPKNESEVAHEKLVKTTQQVSMGFEDFCLDEKVLEERKRAKSLAEPISIFTNAFLPQSSSPSPTRANVDVQKQCYSPKTQTVVRANIPYSPSPSPTPASPTRSRIMRSMSPIAVRQISKRRYTTAGSVSGMESDSENSLTYGGNSVKRQCIIPQRGSPLVRDSWSVQNTLLPDIEKNEFQRSSSPLSVCSNSSTNYSGYFPIKSRLAATDPIALNSNGPPSNSVESDIVDEEQMYTMNENSSTAFSSRAETPLDEHMNEETVDRESSFSGPSNSPARSSIYGTNFGSIREPSNGPPPSPLASKSLSLGS
ncbi:hypothetical protein M3Y98_01120600 [Aphelenchoides besseyi]|nr:hypothetical protein M3Y98_01120600 [Aphelenchoides besseyi]